MIKTDISVPIGYSTPDIKAAISARLPVSESEIGEIRIIKQSLISGKDTEPSYKLTVGISLSPEREAGLLKMKKKTSPYSQNALSIPRSRLKSRPIIVGSGPAGLFCALVLSEAGARPIVLERGLSVEERIKRVNEFIREGRLDVECNIQFGEGGAGTYSDGKLKVGSPDCVKNYILSKFIEAGAPEEIAYSTSAHLGTDRLSGIVRYLREKMISLGAEFIFGARLTDLKEKNGRVYAVEYEKNGEKIDLCADAVVLATGHSARDVFELLYSKRVPMQQKGFGVGVRVEHPREYIDDLVYGKNHDSRLPSASYHLVTHLPSGRSVYSFCMCPGGSVVAAASAEGRVVTNGMSEYSRMADNSNAAILVSVTPEDFGSGELLAGLDYQKNIERAAFLAAGKDYSAPAASLASFMSGKEASLNGAISPSYPRGTSPVGTEKYLPGYISDSLRAGFLDFDAWMAGYLLPEAVITGAETRSTSPIRILRDEKFESPTLSGLFPIGEGAGYSGGIVSSAGDGVRCALSLILREDL